MDSELGDRAGRDLRPDVDDRKTASAAERESAPPLRHEPDGSVTIGSFALAEQVLKNTRTEQAGFNAALVRRLPLRNPSVLLLDGEAHRRQRAASAPFFTPLAVATRYRPVMAKLSDELVRDFRENGRAVLDDMTLTLTTGVAAEIIGLTDSLRPGLGRRLARIFELQSAGGGWLAAARYLAQAQWSLFAVYGLDVRPAIRARRRSPRADLVSSLVGRGWSTVDILTECITYATAGISTTREFIAVAALHLIERDALRRRFLDGVEEERLAILAEILRLEPAVSTILRRTTRPLALERDGAVEEIAAGRRVAIDIRSVNADPTVAGRCPHQLRPDRATRGAAGLMSFGDGPHRCPGASVALEEAAIFLDRLLRVPDLRVAVPPTLSRSRASTGYLLRGLVLATGPEPMAPPSGSRPGRSSWRSFRSA